MVSQFFMEAYVSPWLNDLNESRGHSKGFCSKKRKNCLRIILTWTSVTIVLSSKFQLMLLSD